MFQNDCCILHCRYGKESANQEVEQEHRSLMGGKAERLRSKNISNVRSHRIAAKATGICVGVCFVLSDCPGVRFMLYWCHLGDDAMGPYVGYIL